MCPGDGMVRASDLWLKCGEFDSRPFRFQTTKTSGKLFTYMWKKRYNSVPVEGRWCPAAGKVTLVWRRTGHASQTSRRTNIDDSAPLKQYRWTPGMGPPLWRLRWSGEVLSGRRGRRQEGGKTFCLFFPRRRLIQRDDWLIDRQTRPYILEVVSNQTQRTHHKQTACVILYANIFACLACDACFSL